MGLLVSEDLNPLATHINEWYGGEVHRLCNHLEQTLFMLFFLEEDRFSREEVQRACYALKQLKDSLDKVLPNQ